MKHYKTKILFTIYCLLLTIYCNAQNWQWSSVYGGSDQDGGTAIIADKYGNLFVSGSYSNSFCYFNTDTLSVNGYSDFFLAKYNNAGNEVWIKQLGGNTTGSESIFDIHYDSINDYLYITGTYSGICDFGNGNVLIGGAMFLVKYDLNGNCIWAKKSTGIGHQIGNGLTLDNSGNIYVTGTSSDSIQFANTPKIPKGGFIAKFDSNGNCIWAKQKFRYVYYSSLSQSAEVVPNGIKIYNSSILIAGGTVNDTIVVDTITKIQGGLNAGVISCFDLNGDVKWLKLFGGVMGNAGFGFSIDGAGNSYIGGKFTGTGIFDTITLTNGTKEDAFIAKYDITGKLKWVKQLNATAGAGGNNVCANNNGDTYFTGYFNGFANFGSNTALATTSRDMFVARYDSNGVCLGYKNFGQANGNAVYGKDNSLFWVHGQYWNNISIGNNNFTNHGLTDGYVAKCDALTGIGEARISNTNQLLIYANPNKGTCTITIPEEFKTKKNLQLNIYDIQGKIIQQQNVEINKEKVSINLEQEAKGMYNVTLTDGQKMYHGKIIFE